jgi:hypothetical protein
MVINELEEFIEYVCSTGRTCDTNLFTLEECIKIENEANKSDKKAEKCIRKLIKGKQ